MNICTDLFLPGELTEDLKVRWERLARLMKNMGADGCLLSVDVNLYYTCGRVFGGYVFLSSEGEIMVFVKRPEELAGEKVYHIRKPEQIPEILESAGIRFSRKLLLEADELSYNEYIRLSRIFDPEETGNATSLMREARMVKTPWEQGQLRRSAGAHCHTYAEIPGCYRPGITDLEFQYEIEYIMRRNGSLGIFRSFGGNMDIFMGSLLAGSNAENPSPFDFALGGGGNHPSHPLGADGTVLKDGVSVMVDMSGNYTAYQTDMTRVYSVGSLPAEAYRIHQTALNIQEEVISKARPGTTCSSLYETALDMASAAGLAHCFMGTRQQARFVGHGVGIQINERPVLSARSEDILEPGMVFALEPKFVIPGVGAVGIENTFLVTESGTEKLTCFEEGIIPLD